MDDEIILTDTLRLSGNENCVLLTDIDSDNKNFSDLHFEIDKRAHIATDKTVARM